MTEAPVTVEQVETPANIVITVETEAGQVTWTPDEHNQAHLRELGEGELDIIRQRFRDEVEGISTVLCMANVMALFGTSQLLAALDFVDVVDNDALGGWPSLD